MTLRHLSRDLHEAAAANRRSALSLAAANCRADALPHGLQPVVIRLELGGGQVQCKAVLLPGLQHDVAAGLELGGGRLQIRHGLLHDVAIGVELGGGIELRQLPAAAGRNLSPRSAAASNFGKFFPRPAETLVYAISSGQD